MISATSDGRSITLQILRNAISCFDVVYLASGMDVWYKYFPQPHFLLLLRHHHYFGHDLKLKSLSLMCSVFARLEMK
jgi:hypothetical protein